MTDTHTINVAQEFSKFPGGRFRSDGEFSGERFRNDFLAPALKAYGTVTVELDGTLGYGSSFLEEAFGGLVRDLGLSAPSLEQSLRIRTQNETLSNTIRAYIAEARPQKAGQK